MAIINPEQKPYKKLTPFCLCMYTNFPFIEETFDSMTNYEMLCKIVEYLNNVIYNTNTVTDNQINLYNAFVELKNYVDNFFSDLDVQEEINNKLDELVTNGTIESLINNDIFTNMNNKIVENANQINNILNNQKNYISENQANSITMDMLSQGVKESLTGGSTPVVAKDSISNFNIVNGSIDSLNFNNNINSAFYHDFNYIDYTKYTNYDGYAQISSENKVEILQTGKYSYRKIPLEYNRIYQYCGSNLGNSVGCIVTDNDGNVIYSSQDKIGSGVRGAELTFRSDENCKFAYLTTNNSDTSKQFFQRYFEFGYFTNIHPAINYNGNSLLNPNFILNNWYLMYNKNTNVALTINSSTAATIRLYKITKGLKYKIKSYNYQNSAGLVITDNKFNIKYISATTATNPATNFEYEFLADFEGFILTSQTSNTFDTPEVYVYNTIITDTNNQSELFSNLKIGFTGDSICAGNGYAGGYAKCLSNLYGLQYQNVAVSGGHLANDEGAQFVISNSINLFNSDIDAICMEGGINDKSWNVPLGTITGNYTEEINQSTIAGALEKMFRDCYNLFPGKPLFYVISHNSNNSYTSKNSINLTYKDYIDMIIKVCKKYGVYVINICEDSNLLTGLSDTLKNNYTKDSDGLHPNQDGYNKFYVPLIKDYIQNILL